MGNHPRKADGRRVFSAEFKRTTVQRVLTGEKTVAELSRELDIAPSVIRNWARRSEAGATTAVAANEDVVPASQLREAYSRIRELERLLGRKQMEIEILEAARAVVKKVRGCAKGPGGDGAGDERRLPHAGHEPADGILRPPRPADRPLSAGRRCRGPPANPRGDQQPGHLWLPPGLGYGEPDLSHRLQSQADPAGDAAARAHAAPRVHRRHGRPHLGQIQRPASNQRWCSDAFLLPCWSGEILSVAFAIDCHDREVLAYLASPRSLTGADIRTLMDRALWARFGEATLTAPHAIQWLSDNGPQYTATATVLYAHELGLVPITTPAYSPQSNGLAEAFVKTFKRDYVDGAELRDAEAVLAQLSGWIEDYNTRAPHSALGMRSPADYRAAATLSSSR